MTLPLFDEPATAPKYLDASAVISPCGHFRYSLTRVWDAAPPRPGVVVWVMLNPSTADGREDDPTIRRCVGFSKAWGYGALQVVNLYSLRATDPRELRRAAARGDDVIGPENWARSVAALGGAALVILAWGAFRAAFHCQSWIHEIQLSKLAGCGDLHVLGRTQGGDPVHPLYQRGDLRPLPANE